MRLFGASVGKGVIINPRVNIKYPWKLVIGSNVWIGEKVWIDNLADVTIGDNVCLSQVPKSEQIATKVANGDAVPRLRLGVLCYNGLHSRVEKMPGQQISPVI